jgi:hypothetical protein
MTGNGLGAPCDIYKDLPYFRPLFFKTNLAFLGRLDPCRIHGLVSPVYFGTLSIKVGINVPRDHRKAS